MDVTILKYNLAVVTRTLFIRISNMKINAKAMK